MQSIRNFIGGSAVKPPSGAQTIKLIDPSTGLAYGSAPSSSAAEVAEACAAAADAFPAWSRETPSRRSAVLLEAADVIEAAADELCSIEVLDTGKPLRQMVEDEMPAIIDQIRFFAGACRVIDGRASGEYLPGIVSSIRREPVGVCGLITPWNYPLMMAVWKWAPAISAGNTVVLKPSELAPASTVRMAELLRDVFPKGVMNVICGPATTGQHLVRHPKVAVVSITGSTRAGREVAAAASERLARVQLELGGNAPAIVFADADIPVAASAIAAAAFYNAGQDCTAAARVLVESSIRDEFLDRLVAAASETSYGPPKDDPAFGPLIAQAQVNRVSTLIAQSGGPRKVVHGGNPVETPGFFFPPTVVTGLNQSDPVIQEEIFGPVITVQEFTSEQSSIEMANGVTQGLTASVWTRDSARAMRMARDLAFGAVSVNVHAPMASEMPHGGFGLSGYGKDLSIYGLEEYTRMKHVAVSLDQTGG